MTKPIKILGLDPGLADTGFGLIKKEGNKIQLIVAGSIKTSAKLKFGQRLQEIHQEVTGLLDQYQPDLVAVEKLFFARNVKTALAVGQARGVILLAIQAKDLPAMEFTPLQIKQAITSSGAATKRQVGLMVKGLLGLKTVPKPDDAADALACALTAAAFNKKLSQS